MASSSTIRVRFAPSPTGTLHVGGARTALFNWLFARHAGGKLVLRVEDTDVARSTEESTAEIFESLKWLGIEWDEGPFYQSKRLDLYRAAAEKLIRDGKAYPSEEVRGEKPAVLFKIPKETLVVHDFLRGDLQFDNALQKDLVLLKSDGTATYNFACVVDDAEMKMTHILRGDDHLSNTPKQVPLYQALGYPLPVFVHVPMILGPDGARLSKRHGATAVAAYKEMGIFPDALFNFLALLGWSPGGNLEVMPRQELVERFTLERIQRKSAVFDLKKLMWMNGVYLEKMPREQFAEEAMAFLKKGGRELLPEEICRRGMALAHGRVQNYSELLEQYGYFFSPSYPQDPSAVEKYLKSPEASSILTRIKETLEPLKDFQPATLEAAVRGLAEKLQKKAADLIHPLRVAVTGKSVSPGIFETLAALGKPLVMERIKSFIDKDSSLRSE